jgi:MYXO-CTERM domain-containing protein
MGNVMGSLARVRWVVLAASMAAGIVVATARPASACVVCLQMVMLPDETPGGVELPADRVAFRVISGIKTETVQSALVLRAVEGDVVIPASVKEEAGGDRFFSPDQPLTPGKRYRLHYEGACQSVIGNIGASQPKTLAILAGPPQEVPATVEAPRVASGPPEIDPHWGLRSARAKLSFESSFFSLFRPLLALQVEIDGRPFYNQGRVDHRGEVTLQALCGSDRGFSRNSCSDVDNLLPGRHQVKIIPDIVGVDRDPAPITMEIDLNCDPPAASGCASAGRPAAPPALGWLLALAPLAAAFARRRR